MSNNFRLYEQIKNAIIRQKELVESLDSIENLAFDSFKHSDYRTSRKQLIENHYSNPELYEIYVKELEKINKFLELHEELKKEIEIYYLDEKYKIDRLAYRAINIEPLTLQHFDDIIGSMLKIQKVPIELTSGIVDFYRERIEDHINKELNVAIKNIFDINEMNKIADKYQKEINELNPY